MDLPGMTTPEIGVPSIFMLERLAAAIIFFRFTAE
jgi:hypothetical protein